MATYVNNIQKVSITISSANTTGTATINAAIGTQFIIYNGETTSTSNAVSRATCYLTISGTTITATRGTQTNTDTVTVYCTVVDGDSTNMIKTVQTGTTTIASSATSGTTAISAVTTNNAVLQILGWTASIASPNASPVISYATTTLTVAINTGFVGTMTVAWTVIEFQSGALNSAVQKIQKNWTTSATTITSAITSVTTGNTMLFYCGCQQSASFNNQDYAHAKLTSATVVTFTVQNTNSAAIKNYVYVAEFISAVMATSVQRGTISLSASASGTTSVTATGSNSMVNYLGWNTSSNSVNTNIKWMGLTYASPTVTALVNTAPTPQTDIVSYEVIDWAIALTSITQTTYDLWNTKQAIPSTDSNLWNCMSGTHCSQGDLWNVYARTAPTCADLWNVRARVTDSTTDLWNTKSGVGPTEQCKWNVLSIVHCSQGDYWNLIGRVACTEILIWNVNVRPGPATDPTANCPAGGVANRWLARELCRGDKTLVGFWPLLDNTYDNSGLGNHLACRTGSGVGVTAIGHTYYANNKRGVEFGIVDSTEYYDAGAATDLNFNGQTPLTLSCWFNIASISASGSLISHTNDTVTGFPGSGVGYDLSLVPISGVVYAEFKLFNASLRYTKAVPISAAPYHKWNQLIVTYDGKSSISVNNSNNQGIIIYVNALKPLSGIMESSNLGNTKVSNSTARFKVGQGLNTFAQNAKGGVSLVRAWNRAISEKDAIALYLNEIDIYRPRQKGLAFSQIQKNFNANMMLFVCNHTIIQKMNLFVDATTANFHTPTGLPLFTFGGSLSGIEKTMTLYTSGSPLNSHMNLFVKAPSFGTQTTLMNMYIGGQYASLSKQMPLYITNSGIYRSVPLTITGSGTLAPTGNPFNTNMNLYIKRWPTNAMPMYVVSRNPVNTSLAIFTQGGHVTTSGMNLVMPKTLGSYTSHSALYVNGY